MKDLIHAAVVVRSTLGRVKKLVPLRSALFETHLSGKVPAARPLSGAVARVALVTVYSPGSLQKISNPVAYLGVLGRLLLFGLVAQ